MRLTNSMRDAFVRAAMNDVPKVDYDEKANKLVQETAEKEFTKRYPGADYKRLKDDGCLHAEWFQTPSGLRSIYYRGSGSYKDAIKQEVSEQLAEMAAKAKAQNAQLGDLEEKLRAVAYSVTTREALVKALPEFEKYLPSAPDAVAKNLPAVANLVADFTRAGWPKDKQNGTANGTAAATGT